MSRKSFPLVILLPPSEGKADGGSAPKWKASSGEFGKTLGKYRSQIASALEELGGGDAKLLGVGGKHLTQAQETNTSIVDAPTMAAHERYTGVVWDHMSPSTMSAKVHARATESIIVLSGLLGLVGFDDQIPDYKLKMAGHHVIDLLPNEHRAAWTPTPDAYASLSSVTFVEKSGKVAGHDAKAAKGLLARHVLESSGAPINALETWEHPRFTLTY